MKPRRYNPNRDAPRTSAELVAWVCVRLAVGERSVCSQWVCQRSGVEEWTSGRPRGHGADPSCRVWVCTEPLHRPEVAEAFQLHYDRLSRSGELDR